MSDPRWKKWAAALKEKADHNVAEWTAPEGERGRALIDCAGSLTIHDCQGLSEAAAVSLTQFLVNWYATKPQSILED